MNIRPLLLLAAPLAAIASVNEPMRWEWQTGYRNDNLHWHLLNPGDGDELTYTEHYRNLQFWENALALRVIYRDIAVFARGAGSFGNGSLKQSFANLPYTFEEPQLCFSTSVWAMEGWGYFGYAVNLTADRLYKVILIPFLGCSVNYEHLDRHGSHTATGPAVGAETFSLTSTLPGAEKITIYGPLLGGFFLIEPGGQFQLEAGYAYHWLHLRFKSKNHTQATLFNAGSPVSQTEALNTLTVKDGSNLGHSGWARIDGLVTKEWRCGLFAQIQYFSSRVLSVTLQDKTNHTSTPQKYKARWTAVSGGATISRTF